MNICVAGLGLIGGSMCMALGRAGIGVWGWNRSRKPLDYAVSNGVIAAAASCFEEFDVVFIALPAEATVEFINTHDFKDGAIVADICGVKGWIEQEVYKIPRNFHYVGCHPMAGKEVSSIYNACEDLFDSASMVITKNENTDPTALGVVRDLTKKMGFARIVECSAKLHDEKVAYTSQLAHVVSNAYVKNTALDGCIGFTGGSFQDMTRIAGVDETVWSSLYLKNSDNLCSNITTIINSLKEIRAAIAKGDRARLEKILREGRLISDAHREEQTLSDEITVTYLK